MKVSYRHNILQYVSLSVKITSSGIVQDLACMCTQTYLNKRKQLPCLLRFSPKKRCCYKLNYFLLNAACGISPCLINAKLVVQVLVHFQVQVQFKVHLVLQHVGGECAVECFHNPRWWSFIVYRYALVVCWVQKIRRNQTASTLCTGFRLSRHDAKERWCWTPAERAAASDECFCLFFCGLENCN